MGSKRPADRAITELQEVALTEYEAQCFVALSRIPSGTARDVSDIAELPRTRIYDIAESLQERGLVEIQDRDGGPREFRAVSTDIAVEKLRRNHEAHLDSVSSALRDVSTPDVGDSTNGVWRIEGRDDVIERGQYVSARAEEELFGFFTDDAVFQDNCYRQADYAIDRGVNVVLGSSDDDLREALGDRFPEATIWKPSLDWDTVNRLGRKVSRLVMADRHIVMLASLKDDPDGHSETAIWGEGVDSELVLLLRELLGSQLDSLRSDED
ncbi:helix-turn-helix domain-containing protein [Haloarculaceae archaeon H-GB11]|nr:helix-turn-helix domain-containing protein [Haloarculaceae archaeon H-GB11]